MLIMPNRCVYTTGRSQFWMPPPSAPLVLGIAEKTGHNYSAWDQTSNINLPITGVKSGDILVAMLGIDSDAFSQWTVNNVPSGWSVRAQASRQNGGGAVVTKVCDGTETSPVVMGISGSSQAWTYEVFRIEGADPNVVPHKITQASYDTNSTWFGSGSVTTTVDGCLLLTHVVGGWAPYSFTVPAPYTEEYDRTGGSGSGWTSISGASYIQPTAGAISIIHTCSAGLNRSILTHTAFKPAGT